MKHHYFSMKLIGCAVALLAGLMGQAEPIPCKKSSLLWEISGNGLKKPSYLYGTIHLMCEEDFLMSGPVREAFGKSDKLVMEINMEEIKNRPEIQQLMLNPGMENISTTYGERDSTLISDFLSKHYGAGLQQFGVMKPFALYSMVLAKSIGCDQPKSYETEFMAMAKEKGMPIMGLETFGFQMGIFDKIPQEDIIGWVVKSIKDAQKSSSEFQKMVDTYRSGNLRKLMRLMMEESPEFMKYEKVLLTDRNADWIPKVEQVIREAPSFIAVGAAHLSTDKGVIRLLRKKGYRVRPIKLVIN